MALGDVDAKPAKRRKHALSSNKKKKKRMGSTPTAEELESLQEVENSYHSGLFKMQIDELFKEMKFEASKKKKIEKWLQKLENTLIQLPESEECLIKDFSTRSRVVIPIIQVPDSVKGTFKFVPPTSVKRIGSYLLDSICSPNPVIDIAVEIPKACWQKLDFLNHRYLRKRAFYLACIADALTSSNLVRDMKFTYQNDCYLKPVLLLTPAGIASVTVSLTAFPDENAFKISRFVPARNNVRSSWLMDTAEDEDIPNPQYNALILADILLPKLQQFLTESISAPIVKDGLLLLKLWCYQRGFLKGRGRLNGFIVTLFLAYLLKKEKINQFMNAYQVFRCTLLAFRDLFENGITLNDDPNNPVPFVNFKEMYKVVFIESSGYLNVCSSVSLETLGMLKHEAALSLQILDRESPDVFTFLFMNKVSFSTKFEYLLHLKGENFESYCHKLGLKKEQLDLAEDKIGCVLPKICDTLKEGLNKRIKLLDVERKYSKDVWSVSESPTHPTSATVTVGFLLNPEVPLNNLEKGPLADDPQAKQFREFWGGRSELRRFQDGTIREAVFWSAETIEDKRKVFQSIVLDIFKRHFKATEADIFMNGCDVDCVLHLPKNVLSSDFKPYGSGEEAHLSLVHSFNNLSKQLRSLDDLPLAIASVQGASPSLRFTEVFPPLSVMHSVQNSAVFRSGQVMKLNKNISGVPPYVSALKVVVGFEGSGKWPDDLEAIKRVKTAFLIKIAETLKAKYSLTAVPFMTHVDVLKDGFIFRIEIACHKELFLMKQTELSNGMKKVQDTAESKELELRTSIIPKVTSLLQGLHQQHNSFGTACRLAKRWLSSQLMHSYIPDVTIELLVAYLYTHPEPYTCPSVPQVAFLRFLSLLASHDWEGCPLIVNLNDELEGEKIREIHSSFGALRPTLPAMVVVTPVDEKGNLWTKNGPQKQSLKRISLLAATSLEMIESAMYSFDKSVDFKAVFRPSIDFCDVVIYLKRFEIPKLCYAVDIEDTDILPELQPHKPEVDEAYPIVNYDPVEIYLEELRANFGELAYFLYDTYGGDFIAVVWKKSAFVPKEFKVSHATYRTVQANDGLIVPDVEAILEDFKYLGAGLVKNVLKKS
ncbi:nucleolar protein 6-like [Uloborus diversus]|uniref:nucleolar protein 6-like n=1 Tax=Uloborus diversus TaxID=327109 RepID=UPI0024099F2F|nr:nucleolar protein 6-like [Uloborus diversus]